MADLEALDDSPELLEVKKLVTRFNLFRVLRFEHYEIRHSNVLAWLLQPDESHGVGLAFLRTWLALVLRDAKVPKPAQAKFKDLRIQSVRVRREWPTSDGYLDLLVRVRATDDAEWVVAIENKIRAGQSDRQLEGYREAVEQAFPDATRLFIFLSRRDQSPVDTQWLRASYGQVRDSLKALLESQKSLIKREPNILICNYLTILEEESMTKDQIAALAQTLYEKHRLALDAIFQHRPDYVFDLSKRLARQMQRDAVVLKLTPLLCQKFYVRFLPENWNTAANREGDAWGKPESGYILCEIAVSDGGFPTLAMVESEGPRPWRDELWALAKIRKFPNIQGTTKKPKQWRTVFSVAADFKVGEQIAPDTVGSAKRIWDWVKKQMNNSEFKKAVRVVAQHLEKLPNAQ